MLKGRPLSELPREVLPCFKYSIIDLADDRRADGSKPPPGVTRNIPHVQAGVRTITEMEHAFARGAEAVLGWPIDDAIQAGNAKARAGQPDMQTMVQLIRQVDAEEPVAVRPGARAAAAGLDAEQVVEHRHDEVVVQVACAVPDHEGDNGEATGVVVAQDVDLRVSRPRLDRAPDEGVLAAANQAGPHRLLQLEDEAGADRLDDGRRPTLLAVHPIVEVAVVRGIDVRDRPAAGRRGNAIAEERALHDEHPGRARAADELVRREEDGVRRQGSDLIEGNLVVAPHNHLVPELFQVLDEVVRKGIVVVDHEYHFFSPSPSLRAKRSNLAYRSPRRFAPRDDTGFNLPTAQTPSLPAAPPSSCRRPC